MHPEGRFRQFFRSLYLLRVSIAFWVIIAVFAPAARHTPLFEGLLVYDFGVQALWTSLTVFLGAAMLMVFVNLVLFYGEIRLHGTKAPLDPKPRPDNRRTIIVFFVCIAPACFFVAYTDAYAASQQTTGPGALAGWQISLWTLAGFAAAVAAVVTAKFLQVICATPLAGQEGEPHFILPLGWIPVIGPRLERLYCEPGIFARLTAKPRFRWLERVPHRVRSSFARFGEGYFDFNAAGEPTALLPGQGFAVSLAFVIFLIYELSSLGHFRALLAPTSAAGSPDVPTICNVVTALLFLATLLTGLSFFLDRYRIPISAVILALLLITSVPVMLGVADSDHEFRLSPNVSVALLTPAQALNQRPQRRLVAVAAAGGGIQAAAWTAKVLSELSASDREFSPAVAVMSGVSGGSVGILNYLSTYGVSGNAAVPPPDSVKNAEQDSLEAISWGLTHPDLWRILFPFFFSNVHDRGWALERRIAQASGTSTLLMSQVDPTRFPVMLINSTEAESGAPIAFATTEFPASQDAAGIDNFRHVYGPQADLPISTAVRLSAAFPWVSPAARSVTRVAADFHYVDGGYYDTFGMVSLISWLRAALTATPEVDKQILILEINSFPPPGNPQAEPQPWPYQIIAPILALYDVRDHSQQARNRFEYELQSQAAAFRGRVSAVEFQYNPAASSCEGSAPLSWHLTPRERACIDSAWMESKEGAVANAKACVSAFLSGDKEETSRYCKLPAEPAPQTQ